MVARAMSRPRVGRHAFYVGMAGVFVLMAFGGFVPTYWARITAPGFHANPIVHIHGALFFAWTLYFFAQTSLVAAGRTPDHRSWGLAGISLGTLMAVSIVLAAINSMNTGQAAGFADQAREFAIVPFAALVCFVAARLVQRLPDTAPLVRVRASAGLLLVRAGVSAGMVIAITAVAHALGPKWSGLVAGFPVNSLPVMAILHFHYGARTIEPMVKLWPSGAFGICLFNLAAWLTLERFGIVGSLAISYAVDLAYLVTLNWSWLRGRAR